MPGGPGTGTGTGPGPGTGTLPDGGSVVPPGPDTPKDGLPIAPSDSPSTFCAQQNVGFDLTAFEPDVPSVVAPWNHSRGLQGRPGLVLGLRSDGTPSGLQLDVGSVHLVSAVEYELDAPPAAASGLVPTTDGDTYAITLAPTAATFQASFSDAKAVGFQVAEVSFVGKTDAFCNKLTGTVELTIPSSSGDANFGNGTTVAQVFGAPTHTLGAGTTPNAWKLTLAGTADNVNLRTP